MRRMLIGSCALLLVAVQSVAALAADPVDLRRGVPEEAYLVVQGMHNPERDFQKQYYNEVWKTVQDTEILERALKIITSRMEEDQLAQASSVLDELRTATEPIDLAGLAACEEVIYAQEMVLWQPEQGAPSVPTSQHLLLVRVTPEVAAGTLEGVKNLLDLVAKYTDGQLKGEQSQEGDATLVTLALPPQSPMQPAFAQMGGVLAFASSKEQLTKSLAMLKDPQAKSKFDDPRLAEALAKLPEPEDGLVFYDGRTQFATLSKLGPALQQIGAGDENVERIVKMLDMVMQEVSVFDYEVTVEYTEGNLNRSATYGKLLPGHEDSTLVKMLSTGESFENWPEWVPAGALSYALGTGVNLHVLYERVMSVLKQDVPEAADGLAQFEAMQEQLDLYLDRDILQAFSGEYASIKVPTAGGKAESVTALRCQKPDRIRELIHRGFEAANQIDQVRAQQLKLVESQDLEGFENITAQILMIFGVNPVIGFQDGWMYIGQSSAAVKKVLETKAGNGETIANTDDFKRLNIDVEGPVRSIRYANTAENTRNFASLLGRAGGLIQMAMTMAGANAQDESLKPVMEAVGLLPDVAKIVAKFDFLEARITVVQEGPDPDSYTKRSVTVVRPVEEGTGT